MVVMKLVLKVSSEKRSNKQLFPTPYTRKPQTNNLALKKKLIL